MARILAYTSPALGHLFPFSALLLELSSRGHEVHLRTLSTGVEMGRKLGFTTDIIDPRIEAIVNDDWKASNPRGALKRAVDVFCRRGRANAPRRAGRRRQLLGCPVGRRRG
jgi:UDP:flavonoid glycosyltransferase YjiC (YdhE family)